MTGSAGTSEDALAALLQGDAKLESSRTWHQYPRDSTWEPIAAKR